MSFEYVSTYMSWTAVGSDPAAWGFVDKAAPSDAFTTLHPGIFAGGGGGGGDPHSGHAARFVRARPQSPLQFD